MGASARLIVTGFGPTATAALKRQVDDAKSGDPLAPVDVVVPSGVASVTVRRAIADRGLVNVRFTSLPQLVERLAARHMALTGVTPLTPASRSVAVRRALKAGTGLLARAGQHPSTTALVEGVFAELDDVTPSDAALVSLAGTGSRGTEVADLYRGYRRAVGGHATYPQVLDAAVEAIDKREAPDTQVIVFAPRRVTAAERRLLTALADLGRLRAVVCQTGDGDEVELRDWLADLIGPAQEIEPVTQAATQLELAPDAEEEVRLAVRRVLTFLEQHPVRPERVAIAYRSPVPYARLLDEQLTAAGLPFHVTSQRTLADSVAGHALLQLLDLRRHDFARAEVLDWLTDAPILDRDGKTVPTARWERLSREAGVSRTHRIWRERLDHYAAGVTERRALVADDDESADARERYDLRIADCHALTDFVDEVVAVCDGVAAARTWAEARDTLRRAVTRFLGAANHVDRWGRHVDAARWVGVEQSAYDGVLAAVETLAALDDVAGMTPTYDLVRQAVSSELDRPLPSGTTLGRGVTVATVRDLAGADLDLLVVLGMTEDAFPPRLREHPILRDAERAAVDADLITLADRRGAERRDYLAAVAGARTAVLSCARADTRAQRALHPSPWFMEAISRRGGGDPVGSAELATLQAPWLSRHDSFEAALRATTTPASQTDYDVALALQGHGDPLAATDHRYARGREAVVARRDGTFGEWTGHVGPLAEPLLGIVNGRLSATSLQTWASCGLRFWLGSVLGVRNLDDPGEEDTIDAAVKGSLVHDVLEKFFREALPAADEPGRDPDRAWSPAEIARARELLDQAADALEATGRTGRPLLWRAQKARLHRQLTRILTVDSALRAARRARPIALEDAFGRDGRPPLTLRLPDSGDVPLAGYIDRVDRTDDGGLIVTDYKTGKGSGYDRIPQVGGKVLDDSDLVDRGRKLQLVMYALAARELHGTPETPVESYYWFVEQGSLHRGAPIGTDAERRLLDVLDVTVGGIRDGVYPAHPGDETFFGWESCGFCAYDRICPTARGEQWERIRRAPAVQPYAELADPAPRDEEAGQ